MRHPRPLPALVSAVVCAAALVGVPGSAGARTWSVPTTVPVQAAAPGADALEDAVMVRLNAARDGLGLPKIWNYDVCTDDLAEQWGAGSPAPGCSSTATRARSYAAAAARGPARRWCAARD